MRRRRTGKRMSKWFGRVIIFLEIIVFVPIFLLVLSNQIIRISANAHLFDQIEEIPYNKAGLVLGTSHRVRNGGPNPYFTNRMQAAARLYHQGKVSYLIVSGDNRTVYYNEPMQMKRALIELDVPESAIYLDYAGLRTLDSVVRSSKVFGQDSITIISQRFHNQRAVFIAKRLGMEVVALNAPDVAPDRSDKTRIREWFAKANVFWDIIIDRQPTHLGDEVHVGNSIE